MVPLATVVLGSLNEDGPGVEGGMGGNAVADITAVGSAEARYRIVLKV